MLTCKSVSKALERGDYDKLPPFRKKLLGLHVHLCSMCGPYNGFVMTMQDTAREFTDHEEKDGAGSTETLPREFAEELKRKVAEAQAK
jgi:hypothetical protein